MSSIKIDKPKEVSKGIYEIIAPHFTHKVLGEIWYEYMNFNTNNGTIIYLLNLASIIPADKPSILNITDYIIKINKYGEEKVNGAKEFRKFILKYPEIYIQGIMNEYKNKQKLNIKDS